MEQIVRILREKGKTISTMESCTGGAVASAITDIEGASDILKFCAVTYSNEYKIKMGVPAETIEKFTVYSIETAREMGKAIAAFADSDYGIGITGKLNRPDEFNPTGKDNRVFVSIYSKEKDEYCDFFLDVDAPTRKENKAFVIEAIRGHLLTIL